MHVVSAMGWVRGGFSIPSPILIFKIHPHIHSRIRWVFKNHTHIHIHRILEEYRFSLGRNRPKNTIPIYTHMLAKYILKALQFFGGDEFILWAIAHL